MGPGLILVFAPGDALELVVRLGLIFGGNMVIITACNIHDFSFYINKNECAIS